MSEKEKRYLRDNDYEKIKAEADARFTAWEKEQRDRERYKWPDYPLWLILVKPLRRTYLSPKEARQRFPLPRKWDGAEQAIAGKYHRVIDTDLFSAQSGKRPRRWGRKDFDTLYLTAYWTSLTQPSDRKIEGPRWPLSGRKARAWNFKDEFPKDQAIRETRWKGVKRNKPYSDDEGEEFQQVGRKHDPDQDRKIIEFSARNPRAALPDYVASADGQDENIPQGGSEAKTNRERVAQAEIELAWWNGSLGKKIRPEPELSPISEKSREELDQEFRKKHGPVSRGRAGKISIDRLRAFDYDDRVQEAYLEQCEKSQIIEYESGLKAPGKVEKPPVKLEPHWIGNEVILSNADELDAVKLYKKTTDNENDKKVLDHFLNHGIMSFKAFNHLEFASLQGITKKQSEKWLEHCRERLVRAWPDLKPHRSRAPKAPQRLPGLPAKTDVIAHHIEHTSGTKRGHGPDDTRLYLQTKEGEHKPIRHFGGRGLERIRTAAIAAGYGGLPGFAAYRPNGHENIPQPIKDADGQQVPNILPTPFWHFIEDGTGQTRTLIYSHYEPKTVANRKNPLTLTLSTANSELGRIVDMDSFTEVEIRTLLDVVLFYRKAAVDNEIKAARTWPLSEVLKIQVEMNKDEPGNESLPALLDKPITLSVNLSHDGLDWQTYRYKGT